jgi:hypothetical protein
LRVGVPAGGGYFSEPVTSSFFKTVVSEMPNITKLDIECADTCILVISYTNFLALRHLKQLSFSFKRFLERLQQISLLDSLLGQICKLHQLEHLSFPHAERHISKLTQLKSLCVCTTTFDFNWVIPLAGSLQSLEFVDESEPGVVCSFRDLAGMGSLSNLKKLVIKGFSLGAEELADALSTVPSLVSLELNRNPHLHSLLPRTFSGSSKTLKKLTLSGFPNLKNTDALNTVSSLEWLSFTAVNMSDDILSSLLKLPNLVYLYWDGPNVTPTTVEILANFFARRGNLSDLSFRFFADGSGLDSHSLEAVADIVSLTSLTIRNSGTVPLDAEMFSPLTRLVNLRLLHVSCPTMEQEDLQRVLPHVRFI